MIDKELPCCTFALGENTKSGEKGAQQRIEELLEKNKENTLTDDEKIEIERFMTVEHIVRLAKARAYQRLAAPPGVQ